MYNDICIIIPSCKGPRKKMQSNQAAISQGTLHVKVSRQHFFPKYNYDHFIASYTKHNYQTFLYFIPDESHSNLLPTQNVEIEVLGAGNIPVAILPSSQDMRTIAL